MSRRNQVHKKKMEIKKKLKQKIIKFHTDLKKELQDLGVERSALIWS